MKKLLLVASLSSAAILAGCGTTAPMDLGGGQYSISSSNVWAWSGAGQQSDAIEGAQRFCAQKGKKARITSMSSTDAVAYRSVASGQVTFVCEDMAASEDPVELANGIYMLAGSSSGYQGIKARYELVRQAGKFCAQIGAKPQLVDSTRENGVNLTSGTGKANAGNNAENALQNSSSDLLFRCVK